MDFCPKCGNLMNPEKREEGTVLVCSNCENEEVMDESDSDSYRKVEEGENKKEVAVVEKETENLPKTDKKCPECGHEKAYWWMQQTRSADEASTRFYRCVKCGHTWREY